MTRGEVWWADLGSPTGHEQAGDRPVIILQTTALSHLNTTVIVPVSSKVKYASNPLAVLIATGEGGLTQPSYALCYHLRVLDTTKLRTCMGQLPVGRLSAIEATVHFVLGLPS